MSTLINSGQDLHEILKSEPGVFVLFYASWCPFSLAFLPVYEKRAQHCEQMLVRIELDGNEDIFKRYSVEVYPTVIYFRNGEMFKRLDGKHLAGLKEKEFADLIVACGFHPGS